jgi:hypothetical protein
MSATFFQFSAKKLAFSSKTNVMMNFFQKLAVVSAKNALFSPKISAKISKNYYVGPWPPGCRVTTTKGQ